MQAQVSTEIIINRPVEVKKTCISPKDKSTVNYLDLKKVICKDTFHIGC